jgi:hypothetical protein
MTSGTFTGQSIARLNGTYKGSLSDGNLWTIQITQNSSFDINATGTTTAQGVTTDLSFGPNSGALAHNDVIGATVTASGMATNVNGTQQSQLFGNFVPDVSQVSVNYHRSNFGTWHAYETVSGKEIARRWLSLFAYRHYSFHKAQGRSPALSS